MSHTRIEVQPTSGAVGAQIVGVDLSQALTDSDLAVIRAAFDEHGVIFLRDQNITLEQHIAFASRIGPININRFFKAAPGYPQIAEVRKEPEQKTNIGGAWHTDHSLKAGPRPGASRCLATSTSMLPGRNSIRASRGRKARSPSGTTAPPGIWRSMIITASAA